jgi:hypothetical protein
MVDMFCMILSCLHSSLVNLDANQGSWSLITHDGSPKCVKTCLMYSPVVSSAVISSLQGMKTDILVQS